ncbi:MAG: GTP-binding protein [Candidatus Thermoplasmatota archaeon]|nr:GTP-binding protein [Candidatus Thermoplasmatota archaeon]
MPVLLPPKEHVLKLKVCFVGEFAVGKTSLVNRFVHNTFQGRYMATIGAKIQKVDLKVDQSRVIMTLWDIMGEKGFRELLREAYFEGANGLVAVCDLTRPGSLLDLEEWIAAVYRIAGRVPLVIVANKADLTEHAVVTEEEVQAFARRHDCEAFITSAKTGEGVGEAFLAIGRGMARLA